MKQDDVKINILFFSNYIMARNQILEELLIYITNKHSINVGLVQSNAEIQFSWHQICYCFIFIMATCRLLQQVIAQFIYNIYYLYNNSLIISVAACCGHVSRQQIICFGTLKKVVFKKVHEHKIEMKSLACLARLVLGIERKVEISPCFSDRYF